MRLHRNVRLGYITDCYGSHTYSSVSFPSPIQARKHLHGDFGDRMTLQEYIHQSQNPLNGRSRSRRRSFRSGCLISTS